HFVGSEFAVAGLLRQFFEFGGQFNDVFAVRVPDDGNKQAVVGVNRDRDVDVVLVDDFFGFHVEAGVEVREAPQGSGDYFHEDRGRREFRAGGFSPRLVTAAQFLEFGGVGPVEVGDHGDGRPGGRHGADGRF